MNDTSPRNLDLDSAVADIEARYVAAHPNSKARYERALKSMPGANTRTVLHYDPFPVTVVKGEGARVTDLDGHEYRDLLGEYTAGLYGHSEPAILDALRTALDSGLVLGGPNEFEAQLAEVMCKRFPAIELIRFCNSGTEANMMCASLARAITGRRKIVGFYGGYHGGLMGFPGTSGSPMNASDEFYLIPFNDPDSVQALFSQKADNIAAVILEPMMGGGGCIPAEAEFLRVLRELTEANDSLLIFDEVMTSRLAPGGMQERTGITPDLAAFGKYLGGGVSFGAFGGREDLMARLDPRAPDALTHSGTFNNNVLTMAAGLAGLEKVLTPEATVKLNHAGDKLRERLAETARSHGVGAQVMGLGSMICIHFQNQPIRRPEDTTETDPATRKLLQLDFNLRGFYLSRRGFMSLSLPLTDDDYDDTVTAFEDFLDENKAVLPALS
ncbi:MAG: aspartate aminotransferase family protein [Thiotrichales bacterium]|nr:aspartate aminotransferase family protein [Thiotrichales bacterium]